MAQKKREKEETELKVPESLSICTPAIPAPPSPPVPDDQISSSARSQPEGSDLKTTEKVDRKPRSARSMERPDLLLTRSAAAAEERMKIRQVSRCSGCRRKVGLMGFRCRCGELFCSEHRYSDRHDCSFDYKAAGREAIARENPMVRAAKILKV